MLSILDSVLLPVTVKDPMQNLSITVSAFTKNDAFHF